MSTMLVNSGSFKVCEEARHDNMFDAGKGTFDVDTEGWLVYGTSLISRDTVNPHSGLGCLKTVYIDEINNQGAKLHLYSLSDLSTDLTVGSWYKLRYWARVNTGTVRLKLVTAGGSTDVSKYITSTDWAYDEIIFQAGSATACYIQTRDMIAGEIIWLDDITINEVQEIPAGAKYIEGVTNGYFSFNQPHAYGTWEFEMYKTAGQWCNVQLISGAIAPYGYHGYDVSMAFNANNLSLQRRQNPGDVDIMRQADNSILNNTWYKIKVTRTLDGEWFTWVDGELMDVTGGYGTNPKVDNTYISSVGGFGYAGTGCRIRNFTHRVGAINTPVAQIPLEVTAGVFNFTVVGGGLTDALVSWDYPDGTATDWAMAPASKTLTAGGTVYLNFWKEPDWSSLRIGDGVTNTNFIGDLSVFSRMTYMLELDYCGSVTGDLSSVSKLTYYLYLRGASSVTGDLSDVSNVTHTLRLVSCSGITGDLSNVSGVTNTLDLYFSSGFTGDIASVSNVTNSLRLDGNTSYTGALTPLPVLVSAYLNSCTGVDISQSLVNLEVATTRTSGSFQANHVNYTDLTPAGQASATALAALGWTITLGDGVV